MTTPETLETYLLLLRKHRVLKASLPVSDCGDVVRVEFDSSAFEAEQPSAPTTQTEETTAAPTADAERDLFWSTNS